MVSANLVDRFKDICNEINDISGNSEQEFLSIGSRLQSYLSGSRNLSGVSFKALSSVSDSNLKKAISELNSMLNKFSDYFSHSAHETSIDKEKLLEVLKLVEIIISKLPGFEKIVKYLRMLSISTKIESSRLGMNDNGFFALAENVDRLSTQINEKKGTIYQKAVFLLTEIKNTTNDLQTIEEKHRKRSDIVLNKISNSLRAFEKKLNDCSEKTENITASSEKVTQNISDIVMSIQFHDITRQQLEHITDTLTELKHKLEKSESDQNYKINDELGIVHDVCELQAEQLKYSADEFDSAVLNIISSLNWVAKNMGDIFLESYNLLEGREKEESGSLIYLQDELKRISDGVIKNSEGEKQLSDSIQYVINIVDELSKYVSDIEDIGTEIELLALNAIIKAAHTEINGSALGILAEEIQKLSMEAKSQTVSTSGILVNILENTRILSTNLVNSDNNNENRSLLNTSKEITELVSSMIEMENDSRLLIGKIKNDVSSLKNEIVSASNGITIHKKASAVFNNVINELNTIIVELKSNVDLKSDRSHNTSDLMNKYSMLSEREIHKDFTNNKPIISNEQNNNKKNTDECSLGDNVELF